MDTTSPARHITYVPLDDISGTDGNPKGHDLPAVIRSIAVLGFTSPAVVDERTDRLVIGNGRLAALRIIRDYIRDGEAPEPYGSVFDARTVASLNGGAPDGVHVDEDGVWHAPVVRGWTSRDDDHARAAVVADNKLTERGGWDDQALAEWLDEILDADPELLTVTGFTRDDLDDLMAAVAPPPSLEDLAEEYGEPADADLWPVIRVKVSPDIRAAFHNLTDDVGGTDDSVRFTHLIRQLQEQRVGTGAEWSGE